MGNSGAALSDPTAASYYNPSLLNKKDKSSYSLGGNTLGSFSSRSENKESSSFVLSPSYISSVVVHDSFVHEFFLANISPSKIKTLTTSTSSSTLIKDEINRDQTQILFGYTMAFKSVPFALSYFSQFNQVNTVGFSEQTSLNTNARSTALTKTDFKSLGAGISVSGHTTYKTYSLGYQIRTRQVSMYKKSSGTTTSYVHGGASAADYTTTTTDISSEQAEELGSSMIIGHGFKIGDHEFITDSQLQETSELNYAYTLNQTFGYRMNSDSGHQVLCGLSHKIGEDVKYFGQSAYYSVGYSWLTRTNRTVIGLYAFSSKLQQEIFAAGLTFGSEFKY